MPAKSEQAIAKRRENDKLSKREKRNAEQEAKKANAEIQAARRERKNAKERERKRKEAEEKRKEAEESRDIMPDPPLRPQLAAGFATPEQRRASRINNAASSQRRASRINTAASSSRVQPPATPTIQMEQFAKQYYPGTPLNSLPRPFLERQMEIVAESAQKAIEEDKQLEERLESVANDVMARNDRDTQEIAQLKQANIDKRDKQLETFCNSMKESRLMRKAEESKKLNAELALEELRAFDAMPTPTALFPEEEANRVVHEEEDGDASDADGGSEASEGEVDASEEDNTSAAGTEVTQANRGLFSLFRKFIPFASSGPNIELSSSDDEDAVEEGAVEEDAVEEAAVGGAGVGAEADDAVEVEDAEGGAGAEAEDANAVEIEDAVEAEEAEPALLVEDAALPAPAAAPVMERLKACVRVLATQPERKMSPTALFAAINCTNKEMKNMVLEEGELQGLWEVRKNANSNRRNICLNIENERVKEILAQ